MRWSRLDPDVECDDAAAEELVPDIREASGLEERGEIVGTGESTHTRREVRVRLAARQHTARKGNEHVEPKSEERLENAPRIGKITYIEQVFDQVDQKAMKIFLERALSAPERIVVLLNRQEDQLSWMAGHSVSSEFDVMELIREYLPLMDARGGGKGQLVQGGGRNINGIADFLANVRHKLERNMKNHE